MDFVNNMIMKRIHNFYNTILGYTNKHIRTITTSVVAITFGLIFLMHWVFPYRADDLIYLKVIGTDRPISSVHDIVESQYIHYFEHGGRTIGHSLEQLLLFIGKPQSCVLMALAFVSLVFLMMYISGKIDVFCFMEIVGLLYFLNPEFKETICWYDGNTNYMWTIILILLATLPWVNRKLMDGRKSILLKALFLPVSFLAGWTNENIAPTVVLLIIYLYVREYISNRRHDFWGISYILMMVCGMLFLLLAPGNYVRAVHHANPLWLEMAYRGHGQVNAWCNWLMPLFILLIISSECIKKRNMVMEKNSRLFVFGGVISILAMVISPTYPSRATFGSFVFLLIALVGNCNLLTSEDEGWLSLRRGIDIMLWIGFVGTVVSMVILRYVRNLGIYIPGTEW